ncbi:ATP synthase F0 subunit C [Candidatus Poribacteria bacterium]|nr:ATP synthase F0 subunit C [Candidatus Poribacteria bacterium]
MLYLAALALAVGFGLPVAILAAATAQGKVIAQGLEGMSRQPEAAPAIQTAMLIGLAFIELFILLSFVLAFVVQGKLPQLTPQEVIDVTKAQQKVEAPASLPAAAPTAPAMDMGAH